MSKPTWHKIEREVFSEEFPGIVIPFFFILLFKDKKLK